MVGRSSGKYLVRHGWPTGFSPFSLPTHGLTLDLGGTTPTVWRVRACVCVCVCVCVCGAYSLALQVGWMKVYREYWGRKGLRKLYRTQKFSTLSEVSKKTAEKRKSMSHDIT